MTQENDPSDTPQVPPSPEPESKPDLKEEGVLPPEDPTPPPPEPPESPED